jgi:putative phosphoribosyl transferase
MRFLDRHDAGQRLAAELKARQLENPVVLALPRGGVPVAYEIAHALGAPLDVLLVRKLGAPGREEFGVGAVVDGPRPQIVLNTEAIDMLGVTPDYLDRERDRQLAEIERRRRLYAGASLPVEVAERTVILVDDGVATGGTMLAALRALRNANPKRIVVVAPVAAPDTLEKLAAEADEVVALEAPETFRAVGLHYVDFTQTSDEEVIDLLGRQRAAAATQRGAQHESRRGL